ncbi:MAG TPA: hypothetical protein VFZ31_14765 [Vicinamibacterales bacterium]
MRKLAAIAPALAGAWAAYSGLLYAVDATRRYRAESAWFVFAAVLVIAAIYAIVRVSPRAAKTGFVDRRAAIIGLAVFVAGAVLLYAPMLSIGLLSDDFVLLSRARSGTLLDRSWEFVRPLPLALWGIARAPLALHAVNIVLHGVNAWLTAVLAIRFGLPKGAAMFAGLLFLAFPTSVEAVAWAAGVFDVLMVTVVLAACAALTTMPGGKARTITIAVLTAAALATKETAVVMPAILVITSFAAAGSLRSVVTPLAASLGVVAVYVLMRLMAGFPSAPPSQGVSGYMLKEFLSRPYATLGLPFHIELLEAHRWIAFVFALFWPLMFVLWQWRTDRATAIRVFSCAMWIFVSVLPVAAMLFIADDLQGSRYVYLGSVAFSIMLLALVSNLDQSVQTLVAIPLVALFVVAARSHQSAWTAAAVERDRVLDAFRASDVQCNPVSVRGLPDQVRGAYVFRNGFLEAVHDPSRMQTPACTLTWDGRRFAESR